jgi:hypothetical protein
MGNGALPNGPSYRAHLRLYRHLDLAIERQGGYQMVTGPPCEIWKTAADKV